MQFFRTPDERFDNLADYPFAPHYLQIADTEGGELRMHYLDEGAEDGPVVLLLHGQPTWSYLYRHMIPPLVAAGFRVLAPDLIGLRLVAAYPERFDHVVLADGGLPTGMVPAQYTAYLKEAYLTLPVVKAEELGERFRDTSGIPGFLYWRKFCAETPQLDIGNLMAAVSTTPITAEVKRAYRAPFPGREYLAGARRFPSLVPVFRDEPEVEENTAAWEVLRRFDKPFMLAFSDSDPVTAGGDKKFLAEVPGAQGVAHRTITNAGHFLQEDQPAHCVQAILDITGRAPPAVPD